MITHELLEAFQQPPMPSEPDMGTVDPFTQPELASIARYNDETGTIEDCLDGIWVTSDLFTEHAVEYGAPEATRYIKVHFTWLSNWFDAIDTLDSELRDGNGSLSNAADRLLVHEVGKFFRARNQVRAAALRHLIGDAGPTPNVDGGYVTLSNGVIGRCVTCGF